MSIKQLPLKSCKTEQHLSRYYDFRFNELTNGIEFKPKNQDSYRRLTDYHLNSILRALKGSKLKVNRFDLITLLNSNFVERFDPIGKYFASLPVWDPSKEDYIKQLADTVQIIGKDQSVWETYLRKWLVAVVGCSLKPEIANEAVLILIGTQGLGKTRWLEKLLPQTMSNYFYSGTINPNDKDTRINMAECMLINLDELEGLNRSEVASLKELISLKKIRIRRPYASAHDTIYRRASLMGSVNNAHFLRDTTGSRRFFCFEAKSIDFTHKIPIDQVYAQAIYLLRNQFRYWLSPVETKEINDRNTNYRDIPIELEDIYRLYSPTENGNPPDLLTVSMLDKELINQGITTFNGNTVRLGKIMRQSDFRRTKSKDYWFYIVYPKSST